MERLALHLPPRMETRLKMGWGSRDKSVRNRPFLPHQDPTTATGLLSPLLLSLASEVRDEKPHCSQSLPHLSLQSIQQSWRTRFDRGGRVGWGYGMAAPLPQHSLWQHSRTTHMQRRGMCRTHAMQPTGHTTVTFIVHYCKSRTTWVGH